MPVETAQTVTNAQLYLALGVPLLMNAVMFGLLMAYINAKFDGVAARFDGVNTKFDVVDTKFEAMNSRVDALRMEMLVRFDNADRRTDELKELWRSELHRVEQVIDARLGHLEGR